MKKTEVKILRGDEWQIKGNLVLKKERVYVLKNKELRIEIILLHHDIPAAEYERRWKVIYLVILVARSNKR